MIKLKRPQIPYDSQKDNNIDQTSNNNNYENNKQINTNDINNNKYILQKKQKTAIDSNYIPRPSEFADVYKSDSNSNIFETYIDSPPPHSTSKYIVKETENSSCRLIRSSFIKIPANQFTLNRTRLYFGLYCQPFAEYMKEENTIPIINGSKGILRCNRCNCYINSKFNIIYNKYSQKIAKCNICQYENILGKNKNDNSDKYLSGNNQNYLELIKPTIDFIPPESVTKNIKIFIPHYCIMIDISTFSYEIGFPNYVMNSFQNNLNNFNNKENSFITFVTYDNKGLQFYSLGKNKDINILFMNDLNNPFSPISPKKIFFNVQTDQNDIEILIEKINSYIAIRREKIKTVTSNIGGVAIYSGIETLYQNGGRVMLFSCSSNKIGFGTSSLNFNFNNFNININDKNKKNNLDEEQKLLNTEDEFQLFRNQNNEFDKLIEKANKNRVTVDQFIFGEIDYDLNKLSEISNSTGGGIYHYKFNLKDIQNRNDINIKFINTNEINKKNILNYNYEKLFYDITRIISRNNVYDLKINLRNTIGIEVYEIIGGYSKINFHDSFFSMASCDPDSSFIYDFRINDYFKNNDKINFQLAILYTNNFSKTYLRVINYTLYSCMSVDKVIADSDIDVQIKIFLLKELKNINKLEGKKIKENILEKICESFTIYKKVTNQYSSSQLILQAQIKFLPIFFNSVFKKGFFNSQKKMCDITSIIALKHFFMRCPIYSILLYLYPKLYEIDINNLNLDTKIRLSAENIRADRIYISFNGYYIDLYIFNYLSQEYYYMFFNYENFEECLVNNDNLEEIVQNVLNKSELGLKILSFIEEKRNENFGYYCPLRIFFVQKEDALHLKDLKYLLVEDELDSEGSYCNELYLLHKKIENNLK